MTKMPLLPAVVVVVAVALPWLRLPALEHYRSGGSKSVGKEYHATFNLLLFFHPQAGYRPGIIAREKLTGVLSFSEKRW